MNETDEQLVRKYIQERDEEIFSILVDRYMKHLYNFVMQFVNDQTLAEDIVQETFVKVWKHLARFDERKKFKTWIFTIAKNTAFDALKKKKNIPFSSFSDEQGKNMLENIIDTSEQVEDILDRQTTQEELSEKMAFLTPLYRTILTLCYRDQFSLHEIALILGEPYNTIKSRHQRALSALKKIFLTPAS